MLIGINVGQMGGVVLHEVQPSRRDDSRVILKRGVVSHVIDAVSGPAAGFHETRGLAVSETGILGLRSLGRLAARGQFRARGHTGRAGGQPRTGPSQEPPSAESLENPSFASRYPECPI